jgi:hypothetical protein
MAAPTTPADFIERCKTVTSEFLLLRDSYEDMRDATAPNNNAKENVDLAYNDMVSVCSPAQQSAGGKKRVRKSRKLRKYSLRR